MLLRAIEFGAFLPLGSDVPVTSAFQLVCGTNRDLADSVRAGTFREDLLARIDLWTFDLPPLRERPEDMEPNLDYELERLSAVTGRKVTLVGEARADFLGFARSPEATWRANFRDFNAAIARMATLATGGRITRTVVAEERLRLTRAWSRLAGGGGAVPFPRVAALLGDRALDRFDAAQLEEVLAVCARSASLSEAGRELFQVSRAAKSSANDADRLRKYLARHGLEFGALSRGGDGA